MHIGHFEAVHGPVHARAVDCPFQSGRLL